jgi:hypothetical protein
MKSKKAKEIIDSCFIDDEIFPTKSLVVKAVELAEAEMRERAINAFYNSCVENKNGECHAFIVGYDTPDNRLHEQCNDVMGGKRCKANKCVLKFTEKIDGEE